MAGSASFGFVSVGGWNALSILSPEVFETRVRTTMHGVLTALGRIGACLGTFVVGHFGQRQGSSGIWVPCVFASSVLALGCAAASFQPETSGKVLAKYKPGGQGSSTRPEAKGAMAP